MSFIIGFILGIISTYGYNQRTLDIVHGKPINVFVLSGVIATSTWFSMKYVVQHDLIGFIGFSLGGVLSTTLMAYYNRIQLTKQDDTVV